MNDLNKEAVEEALASLELEDLKVSDEVIDEVLDKENKVSLKRTKGENKNGRS